MAGRYFGSRQAVLKRGAFVISTVDVYFKYNTLLLHGTGTNAANNNTIVDSNATPKTITRNGNVKPGSISPFSLNGGWSNYFNGSTDYLTMPAPTGSIAGDFTLEGWYYFNAVPGTSTSGYAALDQSSSGGIGIMFFTTTVDLYASFGSTYGSFSYTWAARTWYHVAIVRSGTTVTCYVNGIALTPATGVSVTWTAGGTVYMGKNAGASQQYFNGYISNFRLIKGTAVYTAAFTPPTAPLTAISGTSLLLKGTDAGIYDSTGLNNLETLGNARINTAQSKYGGSAMFFDGTGDYLTTQAKSSFAFGTGDYTIECWVYMQDSASQQVWFASGDSGNDNFYFQQNGSDIGVGNALVYISRQTTAGWNLNQWYHVAACRSGGTLRLFVNGTQVGSNVTDSTNWISVGTAVVGAVSNGTLAFNGYMSDLRITKGVARYTTTFTPPTAILPDTA